jgi:hypothetical protein
MYFDVLRKGSDEICAEHGLSVIENPARTKAPRVLYEAEKNGEPTRYNIMRQDIDRAILHSMSPTTFGMCLKSLGYLVNTDPRHKYWTIAIPGDKQVTRMYRLGESYTNQAIWSRIQRQRPIVPPKRERPKIQHYRLHGSFRDIRRMNGLSALFLAFVLILQKIVNYNRVPNQPQPLRYTPGLRASIRLMERYSEEARLLCRNKIQTPEQLKLFADSRNQRRSELIDERKAVYSKLKSAKIPDAEKATLTARRDKISGEIKVIRRELFLVSDIEKRTDEIRQKLRAQREYQARQLGLDKPQQKLRGVRDYGAR